MCFFPRTPGKSIEEDVERFIVLPLRCALHRSHESDVTRNARTTNNIIFYVSENIIKNQKLWTTYKFLEWYKREKKMWSYEFKHNRSMFSSVRFNLFIRVVNAYVLQMHVHIMLVYTECPAEDLPAAISRWIRMYKFCLFFKKKTHRDQDYKYYIFWSSLMFW